MKVFVIFKQNILIGYARGPRVREDPSGAEINYVLYRHENNLRTSHYIYILRTSYILLQICRDIILQKYAYI